MTRFRSALGESPVQQSGYHGRFMWMRILALIAAVGLASCAKAPTTTPEPAGDPALEKRLLEIAAEYVTYGRVDDMNRWSPELCSLKPSRGRVSAAPGEANHGRKLYYLFARDRRAYIHGIKDAQPDGQAIVKEAWEPVPAPEGRLDVHRTPADEGGRYVPLARKDGKAYSPGPKSGLFIMLKEGSGWQYGTVSADGRRVLQSGQLASCLGCHRDARPDSLFGLSDESENW